MAKNLIMVVAALFFISCNKADKYPLEGTTWVATQSGKVGSTPWVETYTLKFQRTTFNMIHEENMNGRIKTEASSGSYRYEEPTLTIFDDKNNQMSLIVTGDVINYEGLTFIKQ